MCWHIECSTFTASSFRIWNSSTEIPSPPLALFIVMFSKAHLTSLPGYLGLGDWSHHRDYLGHEDLFCSSFVGFPGGSEVKVSACNAGGLGSIPELGRSPGGGHGNPLQYSCLENPGQRSLAGYSPWGRKELDMTEWLSRAQYSLKSHCCLPGVSVSFSKFILCLKNKNWKQCKVLK